MQLFVYFSIVIVWIIDTAVGVSVRVTSASSPDEKVRRLQGFGVVDVPTPISKPVLPPIFAPVAVPVNTSPISIPALAPITKPISAPLTRPISAPVPAPTSGFGGGGGSGTTTTAPTVIPTTVSSTESPTSPGSGDIVPTATPTSGSGAVVIDDDSPTGGSTTKAPTKSPISVVQSIPPVAGSWLSFVVTYTSELYTTVKDPKNVEEILLTVHGEIRKSLHQLVKQQNVSIVITLLESKLLGSCPASVNITNPKDMVYPNFPTCNDVKAEIFTKIDDTQISQSTVRDSFIKYISDSFIPAYNKNSTIARLRYMEPIDLSATLNITMIGVEAEMNTAESIVFVDSVLHQHSSNKKQRLLQLSPDDAGSQNYDLSGKPSNKVEILITTSCARHNTCTDAALESFLNEFAPQNGVPLMAILVANSQYFYFDDLRSVIIGEQVIPELPPSKVIEPSGEEELPEPEKMPVWIISLILVMSIIITTTILYIFIRRKVRKVQGDKLQDGIHKDSDEERSNILRSTPFTPAQAPSLQEIQDWSSSNTTQQSYHQQPQSQQQPRDTSIFHKRGQNKAQQPIQEHEEDDEYYDDNKYDNDQFSVEAGNFDDNAYDEHQWNSSFRSYT